MRPRGLALVSGSLDSQLALRLAARAGLMVEAVTFETGFNRDEHRQVLSGWSGPGLTRVDLTGELVRLLAEVPDRGRRSDPCLLSRRRMLREAARIARERGIDLVITGEVLGQRSHGQSHADLERLDRESGLTGRVLRPLSARLLPRTVTEERGGLDRGQLARIHGRSRRDQFALAIDLGVADYPTPDGICCWLADPRFRRRLDDLLGHRGRSWPGRRELELLRFGRQFRLGSRLKVVLSRDQAEGERLESLVGSGGACQVTDGRGSLALIEGSLDVASLTDAAALAARYSRHRERSTIEVTLRRNGAEESLSVVAATDEQLAAWRL